MNSLKKCLSNIVDEAAVLGLNEKDIETAKEFLEYNELGLCFETIVDHLGEHDIFISKNYYDDIKSAAIKMSIPETYYSFLKEQIRE